MSEFRSFPEIENIGNSGVSSDQPNSRERQVCVGRGDGVRWVPGFAVTEG